MTTTIASPLEQPPPPPADAGVLYRRSKGFVAVALRMRGIRWDDVPDLVQDVFLAVHEQIDTYDPAKGSTNTWLYGIASNKAAKHRKRFYNGVFVLMGDALRGRPAASDPERDAITAQEVLAIEQACADVTDGDLDMVVSVGFEGKAAAAIGAEQGLTAVAVRSRVCRTRDHIDGKLRRRDALAALRSPVVVVLLLLVAAVAIARGAGLRPSDLPTAFWPFHHAAPPAPSAPPPQWEQRVPNAVAAPSSAKPAEPPR
jgi:RNA polymerase sigma factor (sigma-70 family)